MKEMPVSSIRIRGMAGGTREFTSIVELEAYGGIPITGDVNHDATVDDADLSFLLSSFGVSEGCGWGDGDLNNDQAVGDDDLSLLLSNWYYGAQSAPDNSGGGSIPEPATLALLALAGATLPRKRCAHKRRLPCSPVNSSDTA